MHKLMLPALSLASLVVGAARGDTLLEGNPLDASGAAIPFKLSAQSRQQPVGGEILFGGHRFEIERLSRHGMIGAQRAGDEAGPFAEYLVLSSSFSEQTAVGQPWVAGKHYLGCGDSYNSFVAIYRVEGRQRIAALGSAPYKVLTESTDNSVASTVYCFVSKPPA